MWLKLDMPGKISYGNLLIRFECSEIMDEIAWITLIYRKLNVFETYDGTLGKRKTVWKRYFWV